MWIHIKCNGLDENDYKVHQDNPDKPFYCIKCCAENKVFSSLNDNQFEICVRKGINNAADVNVNFNPSFSEQQIFNKLNNAINSNTFDLTEEENEDINDNLINCNYYSVDEFVSNKLISSKKNSILHLNIHY